jgi:hypothetical protein
VLFWVAVSGTNEPSKLPNAIDVEKFAQVRGLKVLPLNHFLLTKVKLNRLAHSRLSQWKMRSNLLGKSPRFYTDNLSLKDAMRVTAMQTASGSFRPCHELYVDEPLRTTRVGYLHACANEL